eukprot:CAMPEP_0117047172 /NCGR_PEP_ID=MMETSP0472-20121206/32608_1 /TAXON_ID=693140 ORGANISM="Tiarina fusus, Strain LIS" /NCGR_SAMPLE_ID=MMETSP0472 /ASSEMBLY_ACC=CAM_ASM_000603 /LENGTH=146 /DNA_ID=CAMNT_0004759787 /DNA_START=26 /DNA_END=463 /DNA_ORIENTATION=-
MAPCVEESVVKASPATIWKACFAHMEWEKWDPDVTHMEDVSGGCEEGTLCTFMMKEGPIKRIPCKLSGVKENESLTFSGSVMAGLMQFQGTITISANDDDTSTINYAFDMFGLLGSFVYWAKPEAVLGGTKGGLDNMVKISEEAEA